MRTLPSRLLIDTVVHSPLVQNTRGDTFGPDATITKVCVQDKSIRTYVDGSFIFTSSALMFWDKELSTAATFKVGDKITYTNKATGQSIERYIQEGMNGQIESLHHLELILI